MSKYTLICEEDSFLISSTSKTTKEFEAESLDEVLTNIAQFLRGAGFYLDGDLQVVQPEPNELWVSGDSSCCGGSDWLFDGPQCDDLYINVGDQFADADVENIQVDLSDLDILTDDVEPVKPKKKRK